MLMSMVKHTHSLTQCVPHSGSRSSSAALLSTACELKALDLMAADVPSRPHLQSHSGAA